MGRHGATRQTPDARRAISLGVTDPGGRYMQAIGDRRVGRPKGSTDPLEVRARKAASKLARPGTLYWRLEYELALQRMSMLDNQVLRRKHFLTQHTPDEVAPDA